MSDTNLKLIVVSALRTEPAFENLRRLHSCSPRQSHQLLRWLDESGLALYFRSNLREYHRTDQVPAFFIWQLDRRLESNRRRSAAMLVEAGRISAALADRRVSHAFLKGHSLVPSFCAAMELRHQSDIDILISSESACEASAAMRTLGYCGGEILRTGEIQFSQPRQTPPSIEDDIYAPAFHPEVELHTSIWKNLDHVDLTVPIDCLARAESRQMCGVSFPSLSLEDIFIAQILHAFRHILGSWLRLSWLFEIHSFAARRSEDDSIWMSIQARTSGDPGLRNAFGLVFQLTNQLFRSPIPKVMREWCVDPLPASFRQWISEFGARWALSGLSGSKLSLLIHAEFISDSRTRRRYLWRRILPLKGRPTLGLVKPHSRKAMLAAHIAQTAFVAKRAFFHAGSLASFGIDAIRWNYMLHGIRKQRPLAS